MVLRSVPPSIETAAHRMWHVTLTMAGPAETPEEIRDALTRLAHLHPFLLEARYGPDRAEVRYWEEAEDMSTATAIASRMWKEHERSAGLPGWEVVGLQVLDRSTYLQREPLKAVPEAGWITPF